VWSRNIKNGCSIYIYIYIYDISRLRVNFRTFFHILTIILQVSPLTKAWTIVHTSLVLLYITILRVVGRDRSVVIAKDYELNGPGIECRWGTKFSATVQTVPGTHPTSRTMCTGSLPQGVKRSALVNNCMCTYDTCLKCFAKRRMTPPPKSFHIW